MKRLSMYLYALGRCLYIFTIGYAFKKNRKLVSNMCEIFGYQKLRELVDPEIRTTIPEITLSEIADDAAPIQLRETPWDDGNITLSELAAAVKLIKRHNPRKIFEIGTFNGRTALNLACNAARDAVVYTLDLPEKDGRGIILWHDYSWVWPDVARALNRLYSSDARFKNIRRIKDTSLVCLIKD